MSCDVCCASYVALCVMCDASGVVSCVLCVMCCIHVYVCYVKHVYMHVCVCMYVCRWVGMYV